MNLLRFSAFFTQESGIPGVLKTPVHKASFGVIFFLAASVISEGTAEAASPPPVSPSPIVSPASPAKLTHTALDSPDTETASSPASAPLARSGACFNFKAKVHPLHAPPKSYVAGKDPSEGEPGHPDWGSVSGVVNKSVNELYQMLLNPRTIRDDQDMKITVTNIPSEHFLHLYDQALHIKPAFFITLDWVETWAFSLEEGTTENPKSILVSYEKTTGTSHIRRFCGNYVLHEISPTETGVYLYQELDADRHDYHDILKDLKGTLETLRKPVSTTKPTAKPAADTQKDAKKS